MERLLFVCTGNVCRSPMAEVLTASLLKARGAEVLVRSAGLLGPGRSSTREAEAVMRRRGLDLTGHRSRRLEDEIQKAPDLVIAMSREHARAATELRPDYFSRTFTLKDFVRRAQEENQRRSRESLDTYLRRLEHGRQPWDLAGVGSDDSVADPIGRPKRVYERCAAEIQGLVEVLVDKVWPRQPDRESQAPSTDMEAGETAAGGRQSG